MIVGIGVDIVDVERVRGLLERYGNRFVERVFTESEERYARKGVNTAERFAGRFAVKEAVMKALGTGKSHGILWRDIETLRGTFGKPEVKLHGQACNMLINIKSDSIHVSITHDGGKAIAFVILERTGVGE
jgi:holo-[acyl-carrier protein] synthase